MKILQRLKFSMNGKSVKFVSYFLTFYIASLIIFKMHYIIIPHILNLLLIASFFYVVFITKEYIFNINSLITVYALFSVFALASSFWGIGFEEPSFRSAQLFMILINLFIIYNIIKKLNMYDAFLNGVLLGSLVNYIFILGILPAPFPIIDQLGHRYFGTVGNSNVLSMIMLTSILISIIYLRKEQKISKIFYYYQYINILLAVYMIFLTVSKKGIVSGLLLITIFLLVTMKNPKHFLKLMSFIGIGIISLFYYVDLDTFLSVADRIILRFTQVGTSLSSNTNFGSTGERRYFIILGWDYFTSTPLFGHGLNNFRLVARTYSHNNYIELLFGVGLIGATIFYSIYYFLLKIIKDMKDSNLKVIFLTYILILLMMDMAQVSYGNKFILYTLVYLSAFAENDCCNNVKVA
ncbi:MAG: hypothetical protein COB07_11660 [Sulfurovum sp.]|nr:MAG: hypothetical protein COB07_11660 [Sulfurovum sp.]